MQYRTSKNAINCAVYLPFYPYHGLQNSILDKKWGFIVSKLETKSGTTEQFNLYLYPDTEK
jgi:hypothetical protein